MKLEDLEFSRQEWKIIKLLHSRGHRGYSLQELLAVFDEPLEDLLPKLQRLEAEGIISHGFMTKVSDNYVLDADGSVFMLRFQDHQRRETLSHIFWSILVPIGVTVVANWLLH